jgi:putative phosphoribosyl transferase
VFRDRRDAGRRLADELARRTWHAPLVLGLPRGGVPVAYEVARTLDAPLDVIVARKLGTPGHPELGIGAIAEGGAHYVDRRAQRALGITDAALGQVEAAETVELERRVARYRGDRPLPDLTERQVILVDDGLATGVTARAALRALADRAPRSTTLAVPVAAGETVDELVRAGLDVVCLDQPPDFYAVGAWFQHFNETSDREVLRLLADAPVPDDPLT